MGYHVPQHPAVQKKPIKDLALERAPKEKQENRRQKCISTARFPENVHINDCYNPHPCHGGPGQPEFRSQPSRTACCSSSSF